MNTTKKILAVILMSLVGCNDIGGGGAFSRETAEACSNLAKEVRNALPEPKLDGPSFYEVEAVLEDGYTFKHNYWMSEWDGDDLPRWAKSVWRVTWEGRRYYSFSHPDSCSKGIKFTDIGDGEQYTFPMPYSVKDVKVEKLNKPDHSDSLEKAWEKHYREEQEWWDKVRNYPGVSKYNWDYFLNFFIERNW